MSLPPCPPSFVPSDDGPPGAHQFARRAQQRAIAARRRRLRRLARSGQRDEPVGDAASAHSPTQRQGRHAETRALLWLTEAGLRPLARNLSCKMGEIDLVCQDGDTLVFVEVRERLGNRYGGAAASIGRTKQQRLQRAAAYWLPSLTRRHFRGQIPPCRFDAVVLDATSIVWIRHAFSPED